MTDRPLNSCHDCGDTWHPRGRDLSNKCPRCGSTNIAIEEECSDLGDFLIKHAIRCAAGFVIVSAPVFLTTFALAPSGVNRLEHSVGKVGEQHAFLWNHGTSALSNAIRAIYEIIAPVVDNGASS